MPPHAGPGAGGEDAFADLRETVDAYYSRRLARFGPTPLGVDWSCVPTQEMRFVQLLKLCDLSTSKKLVLNDLGCGYGALLAYLGWRHPDIALDYLGVDLSAAMIAQAKRLWRGQPAIAFATGGDCPRVADYSFASGIFNVALDAPRDRWEAYVASVLDNLRATSRIGFAVNFVAARPASAEAKPGLYSTSPERWTTYCETELQARVALVTGYGMREFTLLVTV
ncbi:methyltransferase domain-containing protein [Aurantimonas aggregata]|uniref:Methyltransferase domain-containing protein n=1 Tax=Aurantimonas aggregata TaxID=2047720 RepID=A0A6L9MLZ7_9HYPH|nr:class I SAM-dependent methyltransferase [Aurantimonas aggregata]NDV88761.1 methyltransferase domain-containing protein [Aurantimonas aggregata]